MKHISLVHHPRFTSATSSSTSLQCSPCFYANDEQIMLIVYAFKHLKWNEQYWRRWASSYLECRVIILLVFVLHGFFLKPDCGELLRVFFNVMAKFCNLGLEGLHCGHKVLQLCPCSRKKQKIISFHQLIKSQVIIFRHFCFCLPSKPNGELHVFVTLKDVCSYMYVQWGWSCDEERTWRGGLNFQGQFHCSIEEFSNFSEILLQESSRSKSRSSYRRKGKKELSVKMIHDWKLI